MAFVHGLVKTGGGETKGMDRSSGVGRSWPHYVSFVIPVDKDRGFFDTYTCESITTEDDRKRRKSHELVKSGEDSFLLQVGEFEIVVLVRPVPRDERCLPYLGKSGA